jgi:hypothetical protein
MQLGSLVATYVRMQGRRPNDDEDDADDDSVTLPTTGTPPTTGTTPAK